MNLSLAQRMSRAVLLFRDRRPETREQTCIGLKPSAARLKRVYGQAMP
jgi:hypothetical protein